MNNKIKNNLSNVKIGGDFIGGDNRHNEKSSENNSKSIWLVPIIVAIIGLFGTIGAALITTSN